MRRILIPDNICPKTNNVEFMAFLVANGIDLDSEHKPLMFHNGLQYEVIQESEEG